MTVRALTVVPLQAGTARLSQVEPPGPETGMAVEVAAVGVCGTDREILAGHHGAGPPGRDRLVLGHEMLGRVRDAEPRLDLAAGDLVTGIVRRPDPVPCRNCAVGEWDMCRNGLYTECGIKAEDGFLADEIRLDPAFAVAVPEHLADAGVLVEPTSVVAKAWEHIEAIGTRAHWEPERVLVTGAGPIGLLAAFLARRQGLEVQVFDRVTDGPKPKLVAALGAGYHSGDLSELVTEADVVVECTGSAPLVFDVIAHTTRNGIVCLAGVTSPGRHLPVPAGNILREIVLENDVVFGSVNANRRHYEAAVTALGEADPQWLAGLVTRRVPLAAWEEAFISRPDDVKVVIEPG